MQEYIKINKYALLNIKIKYTWFLIVSLILSLTLIIVAYFTKCYDAYNGVGVFKNHEIALNINVEDINKVLESDFIKINNKRYKFSVLSISDIQYNELAMTNYQTITIEVKEKYIENMYLEITFYSNKQRIITKIYNLLR